uniref:Uncharacterized protein n=1 Tax=Meleagris gallopavo TaxID=9103 RepID=A0A803XYG0_MELGA
QRCCLPHLSTDSSEWSSQSAWLSQTHSSGMHTLLLHWNSLGLQVRGEHFLSSLPSPQCMGHVYSCDMEHTLSPAPPRSELTQAGIPAQALPPPLWATVSPAGERAAGRMGDKCSTTLSFCIRRHREGWRSSGGRWGLTES